MSCSGISSRRKSSRSRFRLSVPKERLNQSSMMMRAYRPTGALAFIKATVTGLPGKGAGPEIFPSGPLHKDRPGQSYGYKRHRARLLEQLFMILTRIVLFLPEVFIFLMDRKNSFYRRRFLLSAKGLKRTSGELVFLVYLHTRCVQRNRRIRVNTNRSEKPRIEERIPV